MRRNPVRGCAVALLVGLALLVGASPAAAHNVLIGTDPPDGASLPAGPAQVSLRFDLPVREGFDTVLVVGPDGLAYQNGPARVDGSTVSAAVNQLGPAGRYEVRYRILSDDGHPVSGAVSFTVTRPGTGTGTPLPAGQPSQAPGQAESGGPPLLPWLIAAVILVVAGAIVVLRLWR